MNNLIKHHPLDVAALAIGGRVNLALALGVSATAIGNWKTRGIPIEHCAAIEQAVGEVVTRRDLRPDDWQKIWPELTAAKSNQAQAATNDVAAGV